MRHQHLKLIKGKSTKSERRFMEVLKKLRIPFRTKIKIGGREVDFLIGKLAIEIDSHPQDPEKNKMLLGLGYSPIHIFNWITESEIVDLLKQNGIPNSKGKK